LVQRRQNCGLPLDRHRDPNEERNGGIMVTHLRFGATFVLELVS